MYTRLLETKPSIIFDSNGGSFSLSAGYRGLTLSSVGMIGRRTPPANMEYDDPPGATPPTPSVTYSEEEHEATNRPALPEPLSTLRQECPLQRVPGRDQSKQNGHASDPGVVAEISKPQDAGPELIQRFQSEVDGSSSRGEPGPTPYGELPQSPRRPGFGSMVDSGLNTTSTSDLLSRNAPGDNTVRPAPLVREGGGPATQFVGHISTDSYLAPTERPGAREPHIGSLRYSDPDSGTGEDSNARQSSSRSYSRSRRGPAYLPVSTVSCQTGCPICSLVT